MKNRKLISSFAPIEIRRFTLPLTLTTIFVMVGIILNGTRVEPRNVTLIIYGIAWILITIIYDSLVAKSIVLNSLWSWFYAGLSILGLGLRYYILPSQLSEVF